MRAVSLDKAFTASGIVAVGKSFDARNIKRDMYDVTVSHSYFRVI